jgi:lipopolysaccharide transport system permease protein
MGIVKTSDKKDWDIIVDPSASLLSFKFNELKHYKDLLYLLVRRDFVFIYKQTILGPIWLFLQPMLTTIVFLFIFGRVAGMSTDGVPKPLFYLTGIISWSFFSESLTKTANVFSMNAPIFGKVYFPRIIVPVSNIIGSFIRLVIQLILLFLVMIYFNQKADFKVAFNVGQLLLPFLFLLLGMFGLGIGLLFSALTTKYRDLSHLLLFGVQLLMFASPVIFPLSATPKPLIKIMSYNPLSSIFEHIRYYLLGSGSIDGLNLLYSISICMVSLFLGLIVFNKAEKSFVDTI